MQFTIPRVSFPKPGEPGARRSRVVWLIGSSFLVLLLAYGSCTTYVRPGQAGVKQIKFGMGKGIDPLVYGVGLHYVGFGETMHRFPTRLQVLELTNSRNEAAQDDVEGHRTTSALNIKTSEGCNVRVDATLLYRISDPLQVMKSIGPGRLFEDSAVIPRATQDLRRALGELDAEDFYRGDKRVQKAQVAQAAIQAELKDKG